MHQKWETTLNYFIKKPYDTPAFFHCGAALMAYLCSGPITCKFQSIRLVFQTYATREVAGGESLLCFIIKAVHKILISKRFCNQTIPSEVLLSLELPARSPRHGAAASELDALEPSLLTSLAKYLPLDLTPTRSDYLFSDFTEGRRGGADI